jgi:hypothetical protein
MSSDLKSFQELDAIALGVKIKFDPLFAYQKIITQRTIEVARQIGVSESAIQRWKAKKRKQDEKVMEVINRSKLTII